VGEVLSAYEKISVKVRKSIVVIEPEPPVIEISDDEILDYVTEYWNTSVKKNFILLNEKAFDILWKRKVLNSSIITKEKADAIRTKVIAIIMTSQSNSAKESLSSETFVRTLCKKYTLSLYLDNQL
jgi:hypothetical protein